MVSTESTEITLFLLISEHVWGKKNTFIHGFLQHLSPGTLAECYDELGNRYQLPVYCLAPPVNLISERSDDDPSDSPEPPVAPKKEFQLKVL